MTVFLADVHGDFALLKSFLSIMKDHEVIQLGDMGIGFPKELIHNWPPSKTCYNDDELTSLPRFDNLQWIRGNHDHPELSRNHPNYLGEFGNYTTKDGYDLFFISGSPSIPKDPLRKYPGITWFRDEELTVDQWDECLDLYTATKPEVVISHCCPFECINYIHTKPLDPIGGLSERKMNEMLYIHQPKVWLFGHHHKNKEFVHKRTTFICIDKVNYRIYNPNEKYDN